MPGVAEEKRARRTIAWIVALVIVVPVFLFVAVLYGLHRLLTDGDPASVARSAAAVDAGRTATALIDDGFNTILRSGPTMTPQARSVRDECVDKPSNHFSLRKHVFCYRRVVRYFALDGDRDAQQRAWTTALETTSWYPVGPNSTFYFDADHPDVTANRLTAGIEWLERPTLPPPTPGGEVAVGGVRLADESADVPAVYRAAYAGHRYVVAVSLRVVYHDTEMPGGRRTTEPVRPWPSCVHNCPGG
jgi:hypothetical protein